MTADVTEICTPSTVLYMYADDMVVGSSNKEELQETINKLASWTEKNDLKIDTAKMLQMTFRKGGRLKEEDTIFLQKKPLQITKTFKYLGVMLQTTTRSFMIHTKERAPAAIIASMT